ncbi:enoyl-CoA hydratase/isomerase family protein [Thermaerobacter subterraneus]|uniref:short-chain-enoyl-CoA hydratase n=1 Tax=Thermaerobacter subterraneus DSM 13965 TaxID=867903 RepID=K6PZR9_9FIRM|nr:enoyl-CoA hydratase-related protein [Thermaerobacter subterraneus]EKP94308.1 enoyl-CoA hydratase/carnithine racemase [Thermaerobacter subterraneus DSM 13965]
MDHTLVQLEWPQPEVALVRLNRPDRLNAFNTAMAEAVAACFEDLRREEGLRAVVLCGAGDRAFCTGADLKERATLDEQAWFAQHHVFQRMFRAVSETPVPVIAAVRGYCLAGGFEIALNCDFIVAAADARFGLPEVTRGIMPGGGATQILPRVVGEAWASRLIMTGEIIDVETARQIGLVTEVTEPERVVPRALELAGVIAANAPISVRQVKQAIRATRSLGWEEGRRRELELYAACVPTDDRREGMRSFVERRPPVFRGR